MLPIGSIRTGLLGLSAALLVLVAGRAGAQPFDDAVVVGANLPSTLSCGQSYLASVTMQNTGTSVWTEDEGIRLGAVDDSDDLSGPGRSIIQGSIPPGGIITFEMILTAPTTPGTYVTDWRMLRELVAWFGETAVQSVEVSCPSPGVDNAAVIAFDLPATLRCGQSYEASVTMQNIGSTTWTEAEAYRLGAVDDSDDLSGPGRVLLPNRVEVGPGGSHTFTMTLTAPTTPRTYVTDWRMLREGVAWFGGVAASTVQVTCGGGEVDDAVVLASVLPTRLECGQSFEASVTMQNTGTSTWTENDLFRLGAVDDSDPLGGPGRVLLPEGHSVPPTGTHTFEFTLIAPDIPGSYVTDWRMVHDLVRWFGGVAASTVQVTCGGGDVDDAIVLATVLPTHLECGESFEASVTMQNTGTSTWTEKDLFRLGAVDDSDPLGGPGRVLFPEGVSVPQNGTHTFEFTLTGPDLPGSYFTDWQMVHDLVQWFGEIAASSVEVTCDPTAMLPLRIRGNRFFAGNREIKLIGGAVCCEDYPASGWPFISPQYIDKFQEHKLKYVHIRTGPHVRFNELPIFEGYKFVPEAGRYDLTQFEPAFVSHLKDTLDRTLAAGIYTEVDLVDAWPPRNDVSPFNGHNNINGFDARGCEMFREPVGPFVEAWVRHIVRVTAQYPHVMYQVGNETEVCRSSSEFELGVYEIAKDEMSSMGVDRPVGTNSGHDGLDYRAYHGFDTPVPEPIPVLVNETDNGDHSPEEFAYRMRLGLQRGGVYFQGWRGPMNQTDFERLLDLIQDIMEGKPDPPGMACPPLRGTRIKVHGIPGPNHYVIDASPIGLGPEGDDHRTFCESVYYDGPTERGPSWRIVGGSGDGHPANNPYLFHAFPTPSMQIQACTQSGDFCSGFLTVPE